MPDKMTETSRVPMTLRDHFFDDPFFSSSWADMKRAREQFFEDSRRVNERFQENFQSSNTSVAPFDDNFGLKGWLNPPNWMLSKIADEDFESGFTGKDSSLINFKDVEDKMEITLNTSGYKPEDLKVQVTEDRVRIEGKHEEKSEEGMTMVSKQFSKTYSLPQGAKKEDIVSNLSQDGVMVITIPKEKKIQEIMNDQKINVEHKTSSSSSDAKENAARKISDTLRRKSTSRDLIPHTMRDSFFDDPFFHDSRGEIMASRSNFFKEAQESFDKSLADMEANMKGFRSSDFRREMEGNDSKVFRVTDGPEKLELSLETSGYKPDELRVTAGEGVVSIEGKHEEKSEAGKVMVSRQFQRSFALPQGAKPEEVVSNLSKDGLLIVTVPRKKPAITEEKRNVPIQH